MNTGHLDEVFQDRIATDTSRDGLSPERTSTDQWKRKPRD